MLEPDVTVRDPPRETEVPFIVILLAAHIGAPAPPDTRICPAAPPAADQAKAVPVPYAIPPAVGVAVELVPPLAIWSIPETADVNGILVNNAPDPAWFPVTVPPL